MAYLRQRWAICPLVLRLLMACGALLAASPALAQNLPSLELPGGSPAPKAGATGVELPEAIDVSDMVLAAAKQPISVQESPSIITVVTREQMLQRGYRTLWDVLETVPGFEAGRYLFTYRYTDVATRGNFNTVLVLWNGISIVDPKDGAVTLDRKLPLDAIDRVEVTSGPGGVLWGANAYLGVVNIITRDAGTFRGLEGQAGYGHGPGEPNAFKGSVTAAERFFKGKLRMLLNVSFYTYEWQDYRIQADGLLAPLSAPAPDGAFSYRPSMVPLSTPRSYLFAATGNIGFGPVQVDWHLPWDRQYRPLTNHQIRTDYPTLWDPTANGGLGAALPAPTTCAFDPTPPCRSMSIPALSYSNFHLVSARYQDQFWENKIGLTARAYWVGFLNVSTRQALVPPGIWKTPYIGNDFLAGSKPWPKSSIGMGYFTDQYRGGGSVDVTAQLPHRNRAIVGGEVFVEGVKPKYQLLCNGDGALSCEANNQDSSEQFVQADGSIRYGHSIVEYPGQRLVAAAFIHDEWRPFQRLALSAGLRFQHLRLDVDTTAPAKIWADDGSAVPGTSGSSHVTRNQNVLLGAAAGTFNVWKKTHLKVNFTQGFRPPRLFDLVAPINAGATQYPGNPSLDVENSYAIEGEVNTLLLERYRGIRKLYLRADYSFSRISNLIIRPTMVAENAGERTANSVEFAMFLEGVKGWNFWLNYYFLDLVDAQTGPVRNVARQKVNLGGAVKLFGGKLELSTVLSLVGPRDDLNRSFVADAAHATLSFPGGYVTTPAMIRIDHYPWLPLWRVGAWVRNVVPRVDFSLFVDNLLDVRYAVPDPDWQARQGPMPIPMPGLTFMASAWVKL
ncbi:MAG: TonB-dependent receptor [Deltaproteobacteria bacterium]|nr:TonB-dependent receptor [Deltaproteobacteria bacterium]